MVVVFLLLFGAKTKTNFVPRGPQTPLWNRLRRGETLRGVFIHQPDVTCRYDILVTAFTDTYSPINSRWREHRHTNGRILSQWHYSDLGNLNNRSLFHISLQLAARNFLLKLSLEILDEQIKEKNKFYLTFNLTFKDLINDWWWKTRKSRLAAGLALPLCVSTCHWTIYSFFYKPAVTNDMDVVGFLHTHTLRCHEEGCLCMSLFPACVDRWMYLLLK